MRGMARDDYKHCLKCGYILDNLPEPRCPECGEAFDLERPETFDYRPNWPSARPFLVAALGCLAAMIVGYLVFGWPNSRWELLPEWFSVVVLTMLVGGWLLQFWIALRCVAAIVTMRRFRDPHLLYIALLVSAGAGPGVWLLLR
jgi:hypothetical protein